MSTERNAENNAQKNKCKGTEQVQWGEKVGNL
jgi:hypothetical protein